MGRQPIESTLALLSSASRTGRWRARGVTQATALLGSCTIDLREAEIEGDRLVVKASALLGSIHIVVSERTGVDLTGTALLGSIKDRRKSTDPDAGPEEAGCLRAGRAGRRPGAGAEAGRRDRASTPMQTSG